MTKVIVRFANDIKVEVEAKVDIHPETDTVDIVLGKLDHSAGNMTLSYNRNYNLADHRRIAISAETLDRIVVMLKQGYSNRDIADTLGISVESVYQVRIARSRRYSKLYEAVGGWPRTYRHFKNRK
jgi:hypothetical protein